MSRSARFLRVSCVLSVALLAACPDGGPGPTDGGDDGGAGACDGGQKRCGDACVPADPAHGCQAASCDPCVPGDGGTAACDTDFATVPTECRTACPDGMKLCDGACVPQTPANGCGAGSCEACATANVYEPTCTQGQCDYGACAVFYEDVDGDRTNGCEEGSCFLFSRRCPQDQACHETTDPAYGCSDPGCVPCDSENGVAGCADPEGDYVFTCSIECANLHKKCDGRCVPANTPQYGCAGDSCTPCTLANAEGAYCAFPDLACDYTTCAAGWEDRDGNRQNGCERLAGCDVGQKVCPDMTTRCNSDPNYGCGDPACSPCPWPASLQGQPACNGTACGFACNAGYKACGGDCQRATPANGCGAPGCDPCSARLQHVLTSTIVCTPAGCDYGACQPGYEDVDGNRQNGCETLAPNGVRGGAMRLWLRGDVGLTAVSNGFDWRDQSGWGYVVAGRPGTYCTDGICAGTAAPWIEPSFNGTGRPGAMFGTAAAGHADVYFEAIYDTPYTIFVVSGRSTGQTDRYAVGTGGACMEPCRNQKLSLGYRDNTHYGFDQHFNGLLVPIAPYSSGLQVHRAVARFDDAAGHLLRVTDGAGVVQTASNTNLEPLQPYVTRNIRFGRGSLEHDAMNGGVAEVVIYGAALSDLEIALVETYLSRKWRF